MLLRPIQVRLLLLALCVSVGGCGGSSGGGGGTGGGGSAASGTVDTSSGSSSTSSSTSPAIASVAFVDCGIGLCHKNSTDWTLAKTGSLSGTTVTWTVTATRGATGHNYLIVDGYVRVANYCPYPATIGNAVISLNRSIGTSWVTVSSDVATASQGAAATSAVTVFGTFSTNAASGPLEVTDDRFNSLFAIAPPPTLAGGTETNLLFSATFDNTVLGIPAGELVEVDIIFSFGNAMAEFGYASGWNIDIDGNGKIDPEEANVASLDG